MKKRIFTIAMALCLVAVLACGSLAYFTSERTVSNNFMVASSAPDDPYDDPDDIFSIVVDEAVPDPDDPSQPGDTRTTDGNTYDNIQPGDLLSKDPTVTNTGKYAQYVRMFVTIDDAANWMAACEKHEITEINKIFKGYVEANWQRFEDPTVDAGEDTITYVFYLNKILQPEESAVLFTHVQIPAEFDNQDMLDLQNFNVIVNGQAIQTENVLEENGASVAADAHTVFTNIIDSGAYPMFD